MSRILSNGEIHEPISPNSIYEAEFEDLIFQNSDELFPGYHTIEFKKTVESEEGRVKGDLALVHEGYKDWWVVEVEMAYHSFSEHVLPQVLSLSRASYEDEEALYLCEEEELLSVARTRTMMKGKPPNVLVIVNEPKPEWRKSFEHLDVLLGFFQVYRSSRNAHIYRISGDYPTPPAELVTKCTCNSHLQRLVEVYSPASEIIDSSEEFNILMDGSITEWSKMTTADTVYLRSRRANPLSPNKEYKIVRDDSGRLRFDI